MRSVTWSASRARSGRPGEVAGARVRVGDEAGEVLRLGREPVGRDDVVREGLAGERIVDPVADGAEVAPLHGRGGDGQVDGQALLLADALVAHEEERPALHQGPAQGARRTGGGRASASAYEEVRGIEGVVAHELEQPAVELAAAGLGGGVEHAAGLAELGGVGALLDLELLQRVHRGLDVRPALVVVGDVHAVDLERELAAAHAADGGAEMKFARIGPGSRRRAGRPPPGSGAPARRSSGR